METLKKNKRKETERFINKKTTRNIRIHGLINEKVLIKRLTSDMEASTTLISFKSLL